MFYPSNAKNTVNTNKKTHRKHSFRITGLLVAGTLISGAAVAEQTSAPTKGSINELTKARQQAALQPQPNVIYYDAIDESGEIIGGGMINVDRSNPMQAAVSTGAIAPAPFDSTTILNNGPTGNRVDVVLVGDGYTSGDLPSYINHSNNLVNSFFNEGVLDNYRNYFNVHRVDVISNESGVDNDPQGTDRDTALDMTYYCSNIARLLCVNVSKASQAAQNAPAVDQILALANSTTYGGAGYSGSNLGTVAGNNGSAIEVAIHEFGHAFGDLADEYTYGGDETYTGPEPGAANVSIYEKTDMQQRQTKWFRWFDVPGVDTFEGARYSVYGIYRPTNNSKMRSLGQPFGPVNDEQLVIKIYQTVSPIDSATPAGTVNRGTLLTVSPLQPQDHDLTIQWWVDGQLSSQTGDTFNTAGLPSGDHSVAVRVIDNTDLVRDESARQQWMTAERLWTVTDNSNTPIADISTTLSNKTFMGWATPFQFWNQNQTGEISFVATLSNDGPDAAQQVSLTIPTPAAVNYSRYESDTAGCYVNTRQVICDVATLQPGESATATLYYNTQSQERIDFSASIDSDTADPDSRNNTSSKAFGGSLQGLMVLLLVVLAGRKRLSVRKLSR